jgi:excisionase family DNA binding protein
MALRLSDRDQQIVEEAMPRIRSEAPAAARIITRLMKAISAARSDETRAYVSPAEAARILDVTPQTVRNWADRGWLPCERTFGKARRIPRTALASALALSRPRPPVPDLSPDELAEIVGSEASPTQ